MLLIGSQALFGNGYNIGRDPADHDFICTFEDFNKMFKEIKHNVKRCVPLSGTKYHVVDKDGVNLEFEIAWPCTAAHALLVHLDAINKEVVAPLEVCYALKLSHKYLKDSPHFLKTMRDIQHMEAAGIRLTEWLEEWLPWRERETYVYKHPKLDVTKGEFFDGDGVNYVYDHDTIHLTVALISGIDYIGSTHPAYTFYMKDGSEVMTSKDKFFAVDEEIRLFGVYEETCVLALERSQIPFDFSPDARYSFELALMKVCTSITSGYFRQWAYENYDKVIDLYERLGERDYIDRFERNQHLLRPYKGG